MNAAAADVGFIDRHHDEPARICQLIGREMANRDRFGGTSGGTRFADELGGDDAPDLPVDPDDEIGGVQGGNRTAVRPQHCRVHGHEVDSGPKDRILSGSLRHECGKDDRYDQVDPRSPHLLSLDSKLTTVYLRNNMRQMTVCRV
jgi:hypothetical protein